MAASVFDIIARDRASAVLKKIGGEVDKTAGNIKTSLKSAFSPAALIGAAAGGGFALSAFGAGAVKAFSEAQTAHMQLSNAFAKFPQLAGANEKALEKLNLQLQRKTKFDDESTASAQSVLAQFGLTEQQLKTITPLLQDYASRTGKDLPTAAKDLGKAMLGQGRALKQIGVTFKATGDEATDFATLTDALRGKVGGFAAKEGTTAAGKMKILKNQFNELQESVGAQLLPVLVKLADFAANTLLPAITNIANFIGRNKQAFIALGVGIAAVLVPAFIAWAASAAAAAGTMLVLAAPVIAIGAAVAALAFVVIKNWDTIKGAFDAAWNFIKEKAGFIINLALVPIRTEIDLLKAVWSTAWDAIKGAVQTVWKIIGPILREFKRILDDILGPLGKVLDAAGNFITGGTSKDFSKGAGNIGRGFSPKKRALGGGFNAGDWMMTGELGPELVRFGTGGTVVPNNQLGAAVPSVGELHVHTQDDPHRIRMTVNQSLRDVAFLLGA